MDYINDKRYTLKLDLQPIKEYVISEKKSTDLTARKSNIGGWQSFLCQAKVLFGLKISYKNK